MTPVREAVLGGHPRIDLNQEMVFYPGGLPPPQFYSADAGSLYCPWQTGKLSG